MGKIIFANVERCKGCGICELICSFAHFGEYNPKKSFIKVLRNLEMGIFIPTVSVECDLCNGEEKCIKWCQHQALESRDIKEAALLRKSVKIGYIPINFDAT